MHHTAVIPEGVAAGPEFPFRDFRKKIGVARACVGERVRSSRFWGWRSPKDRGSAARPGTWSATDPPLHAVHCCYAVLMEWRGGGSRPERACRAMEGRREAPGRPPAFGVRIMCGDRAFAYPAASPCGRALPFALNSATAWRVWRKQGPPELPQALVSLRRNRVDDVTGCADLHNRRQISQRVSSLLGRALHACEVKVCPRERKRRRLLILDGTTYDVHGRRLVTAVIVYGPKRLP